MAVDIKSKICEVKNFPKPGIGFKDITPVVQDAACFNQVVSDLAAWAKKRKPDLIGGIESRGFLFGAPPEVEKAEPTLAEINVAGMTPVARVCRYPYILKARARSSVG